MEISVKIYLDEFFGRMSKTRMDFVNCVFASHRAGELSTTEANTYLDRADTKLRVKES